MHSRVFARSSSTVVLLPDGTSCTGRSNGDVVVAAPPTTAQLRLEAEALHARQETVGNECYECGTVVQAACELREDRSDPGQWYCRDCWEAFEIGSWSRAGRQQRRQRGQDVHGRGRSEGVGDVTVLVGHRAAVTCLTAACGARPLPAAPQVPLHILLLSGSNDCTVRVWRLELRTAEDEGEDDTLPARVEAQSGVYRAAHVLSCFEHHGAAITCICAVGTAAASATADTSINGMGLGAKPPTMAASGGLDGMIRVWFIATGEQINVLDATGHDVRCLLPLPHASSAGRLLSGGGDGSVRVWLPLERDVQQTKAVSGRKARGKPKALVVQHALAHLGVVVALALADLRGMEAGGDSNGKENNSDHNEEKSGADLRILSVCVGYKAGGAVEPNASGTIGDGDGGSVAASEAPAPNTPREAGTFEAVEEARLWQLLDIERARAPLTFGERVLAKRDAENARRGVRFAAIDDNKEEDTEIWGESAAAAVGINMDCDSSDDDNRVAAVQAKNKAALDASRSQSDKGSWLFRGERAVSVAGACGFTICAGARFVTSFLSRIALEAFAQTPPDLLIILCRVAPHAPEKISFEQHAELNTALSTESQGTGTIGNSGRGPAGFRPLLCSMPALSNASALDELVLHELNRQRKAEAQNLVAAQEADASGAAAAAVSIASTAASTAASASFAAARTAAKKRNADEAIVSAARKAIARAEMRKQREKIAGARLRNKAVDVFGDTAAANTVRAIEALPPQQALEKAFDAADRAMEAEMEAKSHADVDIADNAAEDVAVARVLMCVQEVWHSIQRVSEEVQELEARVDDRLAEIDIIEENAPELPISGYFEERERNDRRGREKKCNSELALLLLQLQLRTEDGDTAQTSGSESSRPSSRPVTTPDSRTERRRGRASLMAMLRAEETTTVEVDPLQVTMKRGERALELMDQLSDILKERTAAAQTAEARLSVELNARAATADRAVAEEKIIDVKNEAVRFLDRLKLYRNVGTDFLIRPRGGRDVGGTLGELRGGVSVYQRKFELRMAAKRAQAFEVGVKPLEGAIIQYAEEQERRVTKRGRGRKRELVYDYALLADRVQAVTIDDNDNGIFDARKPVAGDSADDDDEYGLEMNTGEKADVLGAATSAVKNGDAKGALKALETWEDGLGSALGRVYSCSGWQPMKYWRWEFTRREQLWSHTHVFSAAAPLAPASQSSRPGTADFSSSHHDLDVHDSAKAYAQVGIAERRVFWKTLLRELFAGVERIADNTPAPNGKPPTPMYWFGDRKYARPFAAYPKHRTNEPERHIEIVFEDAPLKPSREDWHAHQEHWTGQASEARRKAAKSQALQRQREAQLRRRAAEESDFIGAADYQHNSHRREQEIRAWERLHGGEKPFEYDAQEFSADPGMSLGVPPVFAKHTLARFVLPMLKTTDLNSDYVRHETARRMAAEFVPLSSGEADDDDAFLETERQPAQEAETEASVPQVPWGVNAQMRVKVRIFKPETKEERRERIAAEQAAAEAKEREECERKARAEDRRERVRAMLRAKEAKQAERKAKAERRRKRRKTREARRAAIEAKKQAAIEGKRVGATRFQSAWRSHNSFAHAFRRVRVKKRPVLSQARKRGLQWAREAALLRIQKHSAATAIAACWRAHADRQAQQDYCTRHGKHERAERLQACIRYGRRKRSYSDEVEEAESIGENGDGVEVEGSRPNVSDQQQTDGVIELHIEAGGDHDAAPSTPDEQLPHGVLQSHAELGSNDDTTVSMPDEQQRDSVVQIDTKAGDDNEVAVSGNDCGMYVPGSDAPQTVEQQEQEHADHTDNADVQQQFQPQPAQEQPSEHGCDNEREAEIEKGDFALKKEQKSRKRGFFSRRPKTKQKGNKVLPARPTK